MKSRWELVEPVLTAWRSERRGRGLDIGRPPNHDLRSLLDAVLYVNRTGIPWRYLPHDYPHWNTVYAYFARWQKEGVFDQLDNLLRRQIRRREGREDEPTVCVRLRAGHRRGQEGCGASSGASSSTLSGSFPESGSPLRACRTPSPAKLSSRESQQSIPPSARPGPRQRLPPTPRRASPLGADMHIVRRDPATRGFTVLAPPLDGRTHPGLADESPPSCPPTRPNHTSPKPWSALQ